MSKIWKRIESEEKHNVLARTIIRLFEENGLTVRRSTINLKKKSK